MKKMLIIAILIPWAANADWISAREVPWATHSDYRIQLRGTSWYDEVSLVCSDNSNGLDFVLGIHAPTRNRWFTVEVIPVRAARYRVDGGDWRDLQYPEYYGKPPDPRTGVAFPFGLEAIERFKAGRELLFVVQFEDESTKRAAIDLRGFTDAFNTLPEFCRSQEWHDRFGEKH